MNLFRVWATVPKKVELQLNGRVFPMARDKNGWWSAEILEAKIGDDYGFILDGAGPFPDPRSPLQPNGVHKLSRLVDQQAFSWTDKNFQAPPLASGNYLAKFAPYFTRKFASAWGEGINFDDPDSGEVRRFFCDNALMWLRDFHIDGLRLDAVHGIVDTSATHFLEQLKVEVEKLSAQLGRYLVLIPES